MDISMSGLIAQILNFAILFFLFKKFLTKPIVVALEERKKLIQKLSKADEEYHKRIDQAEKEAKNIVGKAKELKEGIMVDAGVLGEKKKRRIILEANEHSKKLLKEAQEKILVLEKNLESSFEESVKKTSLLVLDKLLTDVPKIKDSYIKETIQSLKK